MISPNQVIDSTDSAVYIRPIENRDRPRIREIMLSSDNFNKAEVETAMELVDEALEQGDESGYFVAVLEVVGADPQVQGYASYGPTPLTDGVYDLYWIAVDLDSQGKRLGRQLLEYVEEEVRKRSGRMLLIETSSQESYGATIRFYERAGYELAARIKSFYRVGDDKLIFSKELRQQEAYGQAI